MTKQNKKPSSPKISNKQCAYDKNQPFCNADKEILETDGHIMLIEEKSFIPSAKTYKILQKENSFLEKVDLIDYWNLQKSGRNNQTR